MAAQAWQYLFDFLMATSVHRSRVIEQLDLTPNDAKAIQTLELEPGQPIRTLAQKWGTDAPNATWVVDRLERQGLAERRQDSKDRRVKMVALTPKGLETKRAILEAFYDPPPEIMQLEEADLRTLNTMFEKLKSRRSDPSRADSNPNALGTDTALNEAPWRNIARALH